MLPTSYPRYKGLLEPYELNAYEKHYLQSTFKCLPDKLLIARRIGSDSESGKAYDAEIDEIPIVVKSNLNLREHQNEVSINNALTGNPHFLQMITHDICEVADDSDRVNMTGIIIMEKAYGDLRQVLETGQLTENDFNIMMEDVFKALYILAEKGIYHGDFHCGNLFLASRNNQRRWVIGDFGKSRFTYSETSSEGDFYKFISTLNAFLPERRMRRMDGTVVVSPNPLIAKINILRTAYRAVAGKLVDIFEKKLEEGYSEKDAGYYCNIYFLNQMEKALRET